MDAEAAECRRLAAKFKLKAERARTKRAVFAGLERRYLLLAQVNEKEAERLRAEELFDQKSEVRSTPKGC